jgi:tRNA(fMet)-specific endonuclease VapC
VAKIAASSIVIFLDSDHLSVLLDTRDSRCLPLRARLQNAGDTPALPIVAIEEQLRGWLAKISGVHDVHRQIVPYAYLKRAFTSLREWPIQEWNEPAADHFVRLGKLRTRIGTQDLKIACIALASDALLTSANLRDFEQVPGLRVEDWLR